MIETERKEITKIVYDEVAVSGKCDVCGKELLPVDKSKLPRTCRDRDIYDYYKIQTQHHDWGNDSVDSIRYTDCCSLECALKFIHDYFDGCTKRKAWPTLELHMEHQHELTYYE